MRPSTQRRRPAWIVGGVLVVAGCASAAGWAYLQAAHPQAVLVLTHDVAAGQVLKAGDLRVVDVATDGSINVVRASDEATVVGRTAAVPLVAGTPLAPSEVRSPSVLRPGEAVVAIAAKAGQFPPSLAAGDEVALVDSGPSTASADSTPSLPPVVATVVEVDTVSGAEGAGATVSVKIPSSSVGQVATAAAAGRVTIALLPPPR